MFQECWSDLKPASKSTPGNAGRETASQFLVLIALVFVFVGNERLCILGWVCITTGDMLLHWRLASEKAINFKWRKFSSSVQKCLSVMPKLQALCKHQLTSVHTNTSTVCKSLKEGILNHFAKLFFKSVI